MRSSEFQLTDSAIGFITEISRLSEPDYIPTDADILRARLRTSGIQETTFSTKAGDRFRLLDVGGQRSERRKWIHCFDGVTGILFFVAMSEYDLQLAEDITVNRMHESLAIFKDIARFEFFAQTPLILFLNKSDIFRQKIETVDLKVAFPTYTGGCNFKNASQFMIHCFEQLAPNRPIFPHITVSTDTANVRIVFDDVREIVVRQMLRMSGIKIN